MRVQWIIVSHLPIRDSKRKHNKLQFKSHQISVLLKIIILKNTIYEGEYESDEADVIR